MWHLKVEVLTPSYQINFETGLYFSCFFFSPTVTYAFQKFSNSLPL